MIRYYLVYLLLPITALAQDGDRYLKSCASMLAMNRNASSSHFFAVKREAQRQDTVKPTDLTYRFKALSYVRQHDYEQAGEWFEKTAALFPKEHGPIGEFYMSFLCDYPRALHHLDAFDAQTPTFNDMINNNPVSYLRGLTYRNMGNHTKALEQFMISIDPLEAKHGAEWVNYRHFVSRAISYIATGQAEKALVDLDKAAKNFKHSALAQYHRGQAFLHLGRLAEARSAFQDASFFYKALRYERSGPYQEDDFNPLYEAEIDDVLAKLKK